VSIVELDPLVVTGTFDVPTGDLVHCFAHGDHSQDLLCELDELDACSAVQ
jgi:hypothetical protein